MPKLTLGQMISRATTNAGGRLDWNQSDASFYVNEAAEYIASALGIEHRSLESSYATTIGSGVSRMILPSDYNVSLAFSIATARAGQWRTLGKKDIGWADTFDGRLSNGTPEAYVEFGGVFEIVPQAVSSYSLQLRFRRNLQEVVSSASTFPFDQQWDWAVVLKAGELLAMSRGDVEVEQLSRNRFIDSMNMVLPDQTKKWMDQRGALTPFPPMRSAATAAL